MTDNSIQCFVIMPFSKTIDEHTENYWTDFFENFLKPLIEECQGVTAYRSKPLRENLLNQIISELVTCNIVVAILTDLNANVFWELGVRQSFKHGTITIAEKGTKIPFDVIQKSTLFYGRNIVENEKFRRDFKDAILDCIANPKRPDSSVIELISGRGSLFQIFRRDETIRRLKALRLECTFNEVIHQTVLETIASNKKNNTKDFISVQFQTSSIKLLLTNRYLDEDDAFYDQCTILLNALLSANYLLLRWPNDFESVENFMSNKIKKKKFALDLSKFKSDIVKILERIEGSC